MNYGTYRGAGLGRQRTLQVDFIGARLTNQATPFDVANVGAGVSAGSTPIPWDTVVYDVGRFWTPSLPTRFTIPHEGWYRVGGGASIPWSISLVKTARDGTVTNFAQRQMGNLSLCEFSIKSVEHFYAGDYVEVAVAQASGHSIPYAAFATATDESLCNGWITRMA